MGIISDNINSNIHIKNNNYNIINENTTTATNKISNLISSYIVCDEISYNINLYNNIDKNIFYNSGLTIEYKQSPYLSYIDSNIGSVDYGEGELVFNSGKGYIERKIKHKIYYNTIYIPLENTLNINYNTNNVYKNHTVNKAVFNKGINTVFKRNNNIPIEKTDYYNTYYILSSENLLYKPINSELLYNTNIKGIYEYNSYHYIYSSTSNYICTYKYFINNYIIDYLLNNNAISTSYNIQYYSTYNYKTNKYNYYPVLNNYPTKYLNHKFFNIVSNNKIISEYELSSCISDIRNLDKKILYLYELVINNNCNAIYNNTGSENTIKSNSYLLFNTYSNSLDTSIDTLVDELNKNNSTGNIFYNNLSSYINSTYININKIEKSIIGKNNLKNYLISYSNNFIKFI